MIIGVDWLTPHHADIMYYEGPSDLTYRITKPLLSMVTNPTGTSESYHASRLRSTYAFLAHVVDEKREVKDIKDIPEVCNFPDVFLEDLPGVPPMRQVEFRIDLIPGAIPHSQITISIGPYRNAGIV